MEKLAILGGRKIRNKLFPAYQVIGDEEKEKVMQVLDSGILSKFLGCWDDDFYGGPQIRALEREWADFFKVKHAIAVNSATSALYCAVGAIGVGPGDEVIVSPYTMAASATAPLIYNAIPIFADIEEDYYCLDPKSIEEKITDKTKAIIVVDLFGQPYDAMRINAIAEKYGLVIIEDAAQAPGAKFNSKYAGTMGDIGIFSLNYHKHIHCGEGGVLVTDSDLYAEKLRLIRNHAEAVVEGMGYKSLVNMVGFNYRMTEIEAAIAREQLKKLNELLFLRQENANYLSEKLSAIPCLEVPKVRAGCEHSYYVYPVQYKNSENIEREIYIEAVKAELMPTELRESEGVLINCGYVKPLYLQPIFQNRIAFGANGCPFDCPVYENKVDYRITKCPVTEKLFSNTLVTHELIRPPMIYKDLDDVFNAFKKVWEERKQLL